MKIVYYKICNNVFRSWYLKMIVMLVFLESCGDFEFIFGDIKLLIFVCDIDCIFVKYEK